MTSWLPMMAAGLVAIIGGLFALINPTGASITTITLVGWVLLLAAALQTGAAWKSTSHGARIRAGAIAAASFLLALIIFFGNPGENVLIRTLAAFVLIASGGTKIYASRALSGDQNTPIIIGSGAVSIIMGLVLLFGLSQNFGIIISIELLTTGLTLIMLSLHRKNHASTN